MSQEGKRRREALERPNSRSYCSQEVSRLQRRRFKKRGRVVLRIGGSLLLLLLLLVMVMLQLKLELELLLLKLLRVTKGHVVAGVHREHVGLSVLSEHCRNSRYVRVAN